MQLFRRCIAEIRIRAEAFTKTMKRTIKMMALAAAIAAFAVPALGQSKECNDENKGAWYKTFYDNFRGSAEQQKTAVDAANTYIAACPADPADKQRDYMQKFVDKWNAIHADLDLANKFQDAVNQKNNSQIIALGRQVAEKKPDNAAVVYILMAGTGLSDANLLSDAGQSAKKAIELIEAGKPFEPAYKTKDQALAAMNYIVAKSLAKSDPNGAITYFVKAAKYESDLKKNPVFYNELATAYGEGPVDKYAKEYKAVADAGKSVDSPEAKLAVANLNQALDRQIDAFARAAAASSSEADKKAFMDVLAAVYKDRNKKDPAAGELNTLVASALSKPIPEPPTPITTVPATTPASTPATNGTNGTNGGSGNGTAMSNGSAAGNGAAKPATSNSMTGGSAKPASSPTPMNKKPRS